jgi:transcription elongation factor
LRGDALRKARVWAEEKDRKLAPEDYRFLNASLHNQLRLIAKTLRKVKESSLHSRSLQENVRTANEKSRIANGRLIDLQKEKIELLSQQNENLRKIVAASLQKSEDTNAINQIYKQYCAQSDNLWEETTIQILQALKDVEEEIANSVDKDLSPTGSSIHDDKLHEKKVILFLIGVIFFLVAMLVYQSFYVY